MITQRAKLRRLAFIPCPSWPSVRPQPVHMPQIAGRFMSIRATIYVPGGLLPREPRRFLLPFQYRARLPSSPHLAAAQGVRVRLLRAGHARSPACPRRGHERSRQGAPQTRFRLAFAAASAF